MTSKAIYVIISLVGIALYLLLFWMVLKAIKAMKFKKYEEHEEVFNLRLEGLKKKYKIYKKFYKDMRKSKVEPRVLQFKRRKRD